MASIECIKSTLKGTDIEIISSKRWKHEKLHNNAEFIKKTINLIDINDRKYKYISDVGNRYAKLIHNDMSLEYEKNVRNLQMYEVLRNLDGLINKHTGLDKLKKTDSDKAPRLSHREIGCFNVMSISKNNDDILLFNQFINDYNIEWDWYVFGFLSNGPHRKKYSVGIEGDGMTSVANIRYTKISMGNIINLCILGEFTLANVMMGISVLKNGGALIVPSFDVRQVDEKSKNLQNLNTLYLLSMHFEKISIIDPFVSEYPYNRTYLICENYKEINASVLSRILELLDKDLKTHEVIDFGASEEFIDQYSDIYDNLIKERGKKILADIELIEQYKNLEISELPKSMKNKYKIYMNMWIDQFKFVELEDIDKLHL